MPADPRVLICTYGSAGDLLPYLAIGLELRRLGWVVTLGVPPVYAERVRAAGLEAAAIRPDKAINAPDPDLWDRFKTGERSPARLFSEMFLPGIRESWEDTLAAARNADLIVSHTLAFAAPIAAERLGLPWVSGVVSPIAYFSRTDPPALGPNWAGPLLEAVGGLGVGAAKLAMHAILRAWSGEWRSIRREAGLDDSGDPVSAQHSPLLALGLFSPLLGGRQHDWPESSLITGFPFMDDPFQQMLDPDLARFLDEGEPPVVFTLGTTAVNEAGDFYAVSARAAAALGARAVLLTGKRAGNTPASLPTGVTAVPYAPFAALLPRASVVVHQAGIGTLAQVMRAGKPSLAVPFAHDQPDNAARAARLGIARVVPRSRYMVHAVEAALGETLEDSAMQRRAREAGQQVRQEDGARVAAEAIDRFRGHTR
jgi:UDP:flavonoid glycosyltransferase YjiC (YdhE family)